MNLVAREFKSFRFGDRRVLLDVERSALFELDDLAHEVLEAVRARSGRDGTLVRSVAKGRDPEAVGEVIDELEQLGLLWTEGGEPSHREEEALPAVRALCLDLVHNCNMRCTYCYGSAGEYGTPQEAMSYETAVGGVDFLLGQIPAGGKGAIVLFGGEPLLAQSVLERLLPYIRNRATQEGKEIAISMTTNGTLLTDDRIEFLRGHGVGIQVSLDGPAYIHDRKRVLASGQGTYKRIIPRIRSLLELSGTCSLRASLDADDPRLSEVIEHLLELGATFVHAEPICIAGDSEGIGLTPEGLERLKDGYRQLKARCARALEVDSELLPIHAFVRVLKLLRRAGSRRYFGCGMGRQYLTLSPRGEFYACHRFVDDERHYLGNLETGPSAEARLEYSDLDVRKRQPCRDCWARFICGGGCYYQAAATQGDIRDPDPLYCELVKTIVSESVELASLVSRLPAESLERVIENSRRQAPSY